MGVGILLKYEQMCRKTFVSRKGLRDVSHHTKVCYAAIHD